MQTNYLIRKQNIISIEKKFLDTEKNISLENKTSSFRKQHKSLPREQNIFFIRKQKNYFPRKQKKSSPEKKKTTFTQK